MLHQFCEAVMIKIIATFSIFVILVTFISTGITGSGAWFSDQLSLDNNRISTGNIDLTVSDVIRSTPKLEPGGGFQEVLRFCLKNTGSYNMKWRGTFNSIQAPDGFLNFVEMRGFIKAEHETEKQHKGEHEEDSTVWFKDQPLNTLLEPNHFMLYDASITSEPFKPGAQKCYSIEAKLTGGAGNSYLDTSLGATLKLDATQWINATDNWTE